MPADRDLGWFASLAVTVFSAGIALGQAESVEPGRIVWWGEPSLMTNVPAGVYKAFAIGEHGLALRLDGTMVGWGYNSHGQAVPQPGIYKAVAVGLWHSIALREDGTAVSWGSNNLGEGTTPPGQFKLIAAGRESSIGIRADGTIHVWGNGAGLEPPGIYTHAFTSGTSFAAIRTDGTMVTWGPSAPPALPGTFSAVRVGLLCGTALRTDGTLTTFGNCGSPWVPEGIFVQLSPSSIAGGGGALRPDGSLAAWGSGYPSINNSPPGRYSYIAMGAIAGLAIKPCYANCDLSSASPFLSANDFLCFLNNYADGRSEANCDRSMGAPVLTANDFVCFLNAYTSGCS